MKKQFILVLFFTSHTYAMQQSSFHSEDRTEKYPVMCFVQVHNETETEYDINKVYEPINIYQKPLCLKLGWLAQIPSKTICKQTQALEFENNHSTDELVSSLCLRHNNSTKVLLQVAHYKTASRRLLVNFRLRRLEDKEILGYEYDLTNKLYLAHIYVTSSQPLMAKLAVDVCPHQELIPILLACKANVNGTDQFGKTPLQNIVSKSHPYPVETMHEMKEFLVKVGASPEEAAKTSIPVPVFDLGDSK